MRRNSLRKREICALIIVIVLSNSELACQALQKKPTMSEILRNIDSLPSGLTQIEEPALSKFGHLLDGWKPLLWNQEIAASYRGFKELADYMNDQYEKLQCFKKSQGKVWIMVLHEFAKRSTSDAFDDLVNHLRKFLEIMIPSIHHPTGFFNSCLQYMKHLDRYNHWCMEGQSLSYFTYNAFQYTLTIIKKGYSIILQSYVIRSTFSEGHFDANINFTKAEYESTAKSIATSFQQLARNASTRIATCDPDHPMRNETYLEMEKFMQGILPPEITLNRGHSARGTCGTYKSQGTLYYPYGTVRYEGDWSCYGLLYDCFTIPSSIHICRPLLPHRRMDGWIETLCYATGCIIANPLNSMGNLSQCSPENRWELSEWRSSLPFSLYESEQCACICDDLHHSKTLRRFSREYAMSDHRSNM